MIESYAGLFAAGATIQEVSLNYLDMEFTFSGGYAKSPRSGQANTGRSVFLAESVAQRVVVCLVPPINRLNRRGGVAGASARYEFLYAIAYTDYTLHDFQPLTGISI